MQIKPRAAPAGKTNSQQKDAKHIIFNKQKGNLLRSRNIPLKYFKQHHTYVPCRK